MLRSPTATMLSKRVVSCFEFVARPDLIRMTMIRPRVATSRNTTFSRPRWISSTVCMFQNQKRRNVIDKKSSADEKNQNAYAQSVAINREILALGTNKDWKGILAVYGGTGDKFSHVNFATAMSQFGRIPSFNTSDPEFRRFLNDLASQIESDGLAWATFDQREVSNIIHALGRMRLSTDGAKRILDWMSLSETANEFVSDGNGQQVANVAWAFAKVGQVAPNLFSEIDKQSKWLVKKMEPADFAIVAWSFATLGHDAPNFFREVDQGSKWLMEHGKPMDVGNVAWACARLGRDAPLLFSEIDRQSERLLQTGTPPDFANIALACATLGYDAQKFSQTDPLRNNAVGKSDTVVNQYEKDTSAQTLAINKEILDFGKKRDWNGLLSFYGRTGDKFTPTNFATAMTQFSRISTHKTRLDPKFLSFLDDLANKIESEGLAWVNNARAVANTIYAIGKMMLFSNSATRILKWLSQSEIAKQFLSNADEQNVSNVAWGFAKVGEVAPNLFSEIDLRSKSLVEKMKPRSIANIVWAFASLGHEAPNFFSEIDRRSEWFLNEGNVQDVASVAWASAKLGCHAPNLFSEIDRRSEWLLKDGNLRDVSSLAWGCGTLRYEAPNLFSEIDRQSERLVRERNPHFVGVITWSCTRLGYRVPESMSKYMEKEGRSYS